jgi:hypothetical protein
MMRHLRLNIVIALTLVMWFIPVTGGWAVAPGLADRVIEHKLANGLTLLMVERHQTPVVSINMTFGVGGVNEQIGQTGLAHLYEHMAFKGTRTVGTKNYEKERPILEELSRVGTELEQTRVNDRLGLTRHDPGHRPNGETVGHEHKRAWSAPTGHHVLQHAERGGGIRIPLGRRYEGP